MQITLDETHARLVEEAVARGLAPDAIGFVQRLIDHQPDPWIEALLEERLSGVFHDVDVNDPNRSADLLADVRQRMERLRQDEG